LLKAQRKIKNVIFTCVGQRKSEPLTGIESMVFHTPVADPDDLPTHVFP